MDKTEENNNKKIDTMPTCTSENFSKFWSPNSSVNANNSTSSNLSNSSASLSSPRSSSPLVLRRSISNISNSSNVSNFSQISSSSNATVFGSTCSLQQHKDDQIYRECQQIFEAGLADQPNQLQNVSLLSEIYWWYLGILLYLFQSIYKLVVFIILAPSLCVSICISMVWTILRLPLTILKWLLTILHTQASERARLKRCVLITGGSTIQAVQLARNFHRAGARVVICELEGLFGLARFSTACSKFYTLPRPDPVNAAEYMKALKDIVKRERAVYFIPVSATSTAYYDALAKPHLEVLGCECFVPRTSEVIALDDPLELLRRCRLLSLPMPAHFILRSIEDVSMLYEHNNFRTGRYVMLAAGPAGMRERTRIVLPPTAREFINQKHEISDTKPWVVIREPDGDHFITCTTIKESRVVANVTCRVDESQRLIPENRSDVIAWLERFFARSFGGRISGHLSFKLASSVNEGLICIGCRVGVSLPYICYSGIQPRLVWKPCRHFSRQNSMVTSSPDKSQSLSDSSGNTVMRSVGETIPHLLGTVLDKREILFVYWDPLPYCVYYHLQLPFRRIMGAIRAQPAQHSPPLALVQ